MVDVGAPNDAALSSRSFLLKLIAPLLISGILVFAFSGTRPLMDTSEARYAEAAREMAVEGHWLVPHLAGHPHLTKPPLTYWIVAASMSIFGRSEWAARLPIGIAALLTTLLTALCARSMFGNRAGVLAAWLQGLALVPLASANVITTDGFLALFETGFMGCAWVLISGSNSERRKPWQLGFWGLLAGAFMTKGPAGLVPLATFIPFALRAKSVAMLRPLLSGYGLLLFLLLVIPWPLAVALMAPEALQVWYNEAFVNVLEEADHAFPRWAYPLLLVLGAFPACLGLFSTAKHWMTESDARTKFALHYLLAWIIISMLLLSAQKTRLPLYILPLYPPLSMLAAFGLSRTMSDEKGFSTTRRRTVAAAVVLFVVVFLSAKWFYSATVQTRDARRCFKDVAHMIRVSLSSPEAKPRLYIKEGRLGYGLMYYLNTSNLVRLGSRNSRDNPLTLYDVLKNAPPTSQEEFVILDADDSEHEAFMAKHGVSIGGNSAYKVWKLRRKAPAE